MANTSSYPDHLRQSLQEILIRLRKKLSADILTLFLYDAASDQFDFPVGDGLDNRETFEDRQMRPRRGRAARWIIKNRAPLFAEKAIEHPQFRGAFIFREQVKSSAGYPLLNNKQAFGVLSISYRDFVTFNHMRKKRLENTIHTITPKMFELINFSMLKEEGFFSKKLDSDIFESVAALLSSAMDLPSAIWLLDPESQVVSIRDFRGLSPKYQKSIKVEIGDGSIISQIIETGEPKIIDDLSNVRGYKLLLKDNLLSSMIFPVKVRGRPQGAIEVFSYIKNGFAEENLEPHKKNSLLFIADLIGLVVERDLISQESAKLAELAQTIGSSLDFKKVIEKIVDAARELTCAYSSEIVFSGNQSYMFGMSNIYSCSDKRDCRICQNARLINHIITQDTPVILSEGDPYEISNGKIDRKVRSMMKEEGIRSLTGIPIRMGYDLDCVLYVCGKQKKQFSGHHIALLENLGYILSGIIGRSHNILKATREIDNAIYNLLEKKNIIDEFCENIQKTLKFQFVTVSMIRFEENVIEAVSGRGIGEDWIGLAKHSLIKHQGVIPDIQADIALSEPPRTEIISKWDKRFDFWIYKEFEHHKIVRITTPIILLKDSLGNVIEEWPDGFEWKTVKNEIKTDGGQHTVLELTYPGMDSHEDTRIIPWIVGNVGAGYQREIKPSIEPAEAIKLHTFIAENSHKVRDTLLHNVLQKIADWAKQIFSADSAIIHFGYDPNIEDFCYKVDSLHTHIPPSIRSHLKDFSLREIRKIKPTIGIPSKDNVTGDSDVDKPVTPALANIAIQSYPLCTGDEKDDIGIQDGAMHILLSKGRELSENEHEWLNYLIEKAKDAIQNATTFTQLNERTLQLSTLNQITGRLTEKTSLEENTLIPFIANFVRNLLAADIVVIYEYDFPTKKCNSDPEISGRLIVELDSKKPLTNESVPMQLVEKGNNIYAPCVQENDIFFNKALKESPDRLLFVERENVKSAAGILLKAEEEIVGVMFVNYRRLHFFSAEQTEIIETLAYSTAIAIKNQKMLRKRQDDLHSLEHDIQAPMANALTKMNIMDPSRLDKSDKSHFEVARAIAEDVQLNLSAIILRLLYEAEQKEKFLSEEIDTESEIQDMFSRFNLIYLDRDLNLKYKKDSEFPSELMNKNIFRSIIRCLIENAFKYANKGTDVDVRAIHNPDSKESSVHITSIGKAIDPEERDKIFMKYYRGKNVKLEPRVRGVGFGLWAARQLMREIGGNLTLGVDETQPEKSEFIVHIPKEAQ